MEVQEVVLWRLPKAEAWWDGHSFGVTLSLATHARGGGAGAVTAAANKKDLERAELLWLRARLVCQGASSTSQAGSRCSEQLKNWQVAVNFSGKVVKRSV